MEEETWQSKFLNAGTEKGLGDLSMMIGVVSDIITKARKKALNEMFMEIVELAEPDERQFSAGDLNTNMDDIYAIVQKLTTNP